MKSSYEDRRVSITIPQLQNKPPTSQAESISSNYLSIIFETFLGRLFPFHGLTLLDENGHLLHL